MMKTDRYSTQLNVKCTSEQAFKALTIHLDKWWGDQDQPVTKVGDVFTVSWGEPWYQFETIEYVPNEKVSWECVDSKQIIGDLEGVEKEWMGTKLYWTISEVQGEVIIDFQHEGLVPEFICYDVCSTAWSRFIEFDLKEYLESS